MGRAVRAASSDQLGVIQVTEGRSSSWSVSRASGGRRLEPELARRMGSRTMGVFGSQPNARKAATVEAISADPSIPILTPAGGRSAQRYWSVC